MVFLMFTIGLEFCLSQLKAMQRLVFGLGGAQVGLTALGVLGLAEPGLIGASSMAALGGVIAMSSTAIVSKLLAERVELHAPHGRRIMGILLFQDLAVVPFLIVIPALGGDGSQSVLSALGWALVKSLLVLAAILFVGRMWLRPIFHEVALARSREFFTLTVLLLTLLAAWFTHHAGLSLALGAFLAGLMIGETEYRHQVENDILPFRDVLLGLFFITVGMNLDLHVLREQWYWALLAMSAMLVIKIAIVFLVARLFRFETGVALRTGLVLAAGGEFGFALLVQAVQYRVLSVSSVQLVLAAIVLSMLIAPLLIRYNGAIVKRLVPGYRERRESNLDSIRATAGHAHGHVILCGFGRSGQNLAWMLKEEGLSYLGLDLDPVRVRDARDAGEPVVFGDSARRDVLLAAGLQHARALVISFVDVPTATRILSATRDLRPDMPVIVRTLDDRDLETLKAAGATEVVPESLEGSLMMGSHLLMLLGVPVSRVLRQVQSVRRDRYRMLRGFFHGAAGVDETEESYRERLHSVTLPVQAFAVGKKLAELPLAESGVTVTAVRRGGITGPEPEPDTKLIAGDVLVLFGKPEALEHAEKVLLEG
ncbi:MAG TPA: potassium transporter [Gammaproteobacteria bacterium]|nr:potassium transporter [Gammaproteobacteria bacterium]